MKAAAECPAEGTRRDMAKGSESKSGTPPRIAGVREGTRAKVFPDALSFLAAAPEDDVNRLVEELRKGGIEAAYSIATTPLDLSRALVAEPWDVVIVRPGLAGLDWIDALALTRAAREDLQCAVLLRTCDSSAAVGFHDAGADDVLCLENPMLVPAVVRLAREAERRRVQGHHWREMHRDATQWRNMVDNTLLGIFRCKPWGELVQVNGAFASIFGYADPETLLRDMRTEGERTFLDREQMGRFLDSLAESGSVSDFETCVYRPDGTRLWVTVHARLQHGPEGEVTSIEGTVEDIERRKSFEAMIINAKQEWEKTFDSVPDIIIIFDASMRIRRSNKALGRLLGLHPRDLVGRRCEEVLGTGETQNDACTALRIRSVTESRTEELHLPLLGGDYLVTVSPLDTGRDEDLAAGTVMVAHDIGKRKKLEAQLRQAQKMEAIGTLAGGIAHDFNNILGVMMGYTEMSLDQVEEGAPLHRRLSEVLEAGRRARDLIHQILTISRQEEPARQLLALPGPIRETLRLLRATIPANIDIRVDIAETGAVLANQSQMQQVVMNLCTNAAHAMRDKGGVLAVSLDAVNLDPDEATRRSLDHAGAYTRLRVRDTGHGIPAEIHESVFDPFFTTKKPDEGTGMGLALVHGIVTAHGGTIAFTSTPGYGTEFEILLPVASAPALSPVTPSSSAPTGGGEVLVVDDEASLALILGEMLESMGYRADITTSPVEALERFTSAPRRWAFVVTDQTMPGMTGLELAEHIHGLVPALPVILCTGFSEGLTSETAQRSGITSLLFKPVLRADLANAVMELDHLAR